MNGEHKTETEYEEINLMNYLKVIIKRKRLILGLFLISVVAVGVYSFFVTPKIYEINTVLEASGQEVILMEKIKSGIYWEKLGIPERECPKIKTENPLNTNLVIIKIESAQPPKVKNVLEELNNFIVAESQERIKLQKESMENEITMTASAIKLIEKDIEITKGDIIRAEEEIKRVENKIIYTEEEKKILEAKVEALEKILASEQTLGAGTQFALFSTRERLAEKKQEIEDLYLKVNSQKAEKENLGAKIKSLERDIENTNIKINFLKASLEELKPIRILKTPSISEGPIKPRPLLNLIIAGALGIFLGVFFSLGKEWWEKNKWVFHRFA